MEIEAMRFFFATTGDPATVTCLSGTLIISANVNDLTRAVDCVTCGWRNKSIVTVLHAKHTLAAVVETHNMGQTLAIRFFNYFLN